MVQLWGQGLANPSSLGEKGHRDQILTLVYSYYHRAYNIRKKSCSYVLFFAQVSHYSLSFLLSPTAQVHLVHYRDSNLQ